MATNFYIKFRNTDPPPLFLGIIPKKQFFFCFPNATDSTKKSRTYRAPKPEPILQTTRQEIEKALGALHLSLFPSCAPPLH